MSELGFGILVVASAILALSPVLRRSGWPFNQGTAAPLLLVQLYAAHLRHFDLFPVWSSSDGLGMGSPVLLFYHRTFYYVAGLLFALFNDLKFSVVATLFIFLVMGAYGMRHALGVVTRRRLLSTVGALGFLFTNYVFTDWLDPRGDLGEFAALMIVPWLIFWCLNLVKNRQVSLILIPVMVLLVNAHSAIALISLFSLLVALTVFLVSGGREGWRAIRARLIVVSTSILALLLPLLIAEWRFLPSYDPQVKNVISFPISSNFDSFGRYFYDGSHTWFAGNQVPPFNNFVQIDFAIWIPLFAIAAVLGVRWIILLAKGRRGAWRMMTSRSDRRIFSFLLISLAGYLFLQLHVSYFVYRLLSPLQVINFPWRMLAFITPLGIILVVAVADKLASRFPNRILWAALSIGWITAVILPSPVTAAVPNFYDDHFGPGFHVREQLLATPGQFPPINLFYAPATIDYRDFNGFLIVPSVPQIFRGALYNDFLPKVVDQRGQEIKDLTSLYAELHSKQAAGGSLTDVPCKVIGPKNAALETLALTFRVSCAAPTKLALPISFNPSSSVFSRSARGTHQIPYFHVRTDPRIIIQVESSQPESIIVHLPTLWGTLF